MPKNTAIGTVGLLLLLFAFIMNRLRLWHEDHKVYLALNTLGASMACAHAARAGTVPFVILAGVWALFAAAKIAQKKLPHNGSFHMQSPVGD